MQSKIFFDVGVLYYLPQYLPVYRELVARGASCRFVFHRDNVTGGLATQVVEQEKFPASVVASPAEAVAVYQEEKPDWIIFGNGCSFLGQLPKNTRTALLYHGIGIKDCYYDENLLEMDIRFVEGNFRRDEIIRRFPDARVLPAGFAKLDPMFQPSPPALDLESLGLAPQKKTLLYAPTYYPSSIELLPDDLPARISDINFIVKPHFFTFTGEKYKKQLAKINRWRRYGNVYVAPPEEYSLLSFFGSADILVSEASSALFEFAALDKPVVWLDFFKLRWTYRGPLRFRFERRMDKTILKYADVAAHARRPGDFVDVVRQELANPQGLSAMRRRCTEELIGLTDGKASERIAAFLMENRHP